MDRSLPVDASTVLGTVLILGTLLPTSTLTGDAVKACAHVLECLEQHAQLSCTLHLLPHEPAFALKLENGLAETADVKKILRELQLPWCRPAANPPAYASFQCRWF